MTPSAADPTGQPTRVRYAVLGLLCLLAMITYIDRAVIGKANQDIIAAVGRPKDDWFWLLVAFQLAYALFEVPSGWMGDRFGPRGTILRIVLWWSMFVALTGMAGWTVVTGGSEVVLIGFGTLVAIQFLFGAGEAGAFPNITRSLYNWFPATQRGFAQGAVWMSARFMGGLTPLVWLVLTTFLGLTWRQVFWILAGLAVVWAAAFAWYFRNHPHEHADTNAAEQDLIAAGRTAADGQAHSGVPWGKLVASPNLWAICGMYFCMNFGWYFFMYFLPNFMESRFGSKTDSAGSKVVLALLQGGPLLLGMAGCWLGGMLTDRYVRLTGDRRWGRRLYGMLGFGMASACYAAAVFGAGNVWAFAACIALAGFFNDLALAPCWATCQDVGRRYAAIVSGAMNMIGNLGAALTNFVTGSLLKAYAAPEGASDAVRQELTTQGYAACMSMYAVAYAIGLVFWLFIDASRPIAAEDAGPHDAAV